MIQYHEEFDVPALTIIAASSDSTWYPSTSFWSSFQNASKEVICWTEETFGSDWLIPSTT
jgi:hypothetical protein